MTLAGDQGPSATGPVLLRDRCLRVHDAGPRFGLMAGVAHASLAVAALVPQQGRTQRRAQAAGRLPAQTDRLPDLVLCSTARRTGETLREQRCRCLRTEMPYVFRKPMGRRTLVLQSPPRSQAARVMESGAEMGGR
ncbi:hypothetical protein GCM10010361_67070 [Streptomyces olivaceiscleroticus]|uniref:Uncharacterized protein n=1 Tax=Streptomyces olivaceiscleroticus TaxID=68245 RepID=A0ABP3L4P1_9ACTN